MNERRSFAEFNIESSWYKWWLIGECSNEEDDDNDEDGSDGDNCPRGGGTDGLVGQTEIVNEDMEINYQ